MRSALGQGLLPSRRWGSPNPLRPPLVLLHGLYGRGDQWCLYATALRSVFDVIALDLRNHGGAFHAPTQAHAEMVGDVMRTLDSLGVERFWAMGHSMGGRVAMQLAQREPTRVLGCVSLDAPIPGAQFSPKLAGYHQRVVGVLRGVKGTERMPREELRGVLAERGLDRQMAGYALRNYILRDGVWGWRIGLEGIADHAFNRLSEPMDDAPITCPFLLVEAKRSILCRHITAEMFARFAPSGTRQVDVGATHLSLLFRPELATHWLIDRVG